MQKSLDLVAESGLDIDLDAGRQIEFGVDLDAKATAWTRGGAAEWTPLAVIWSRSYLR